MKKKFSICLHRVSNEVSPAYPPIPVSVFERLMKYIQKKYGFLSLADLHDEQKGGVLLTFDDAYLDFYENAYPILKKLGIPSVLNVITSSAETGNSFWTQQLNKLVEAFYEKGREQELSDLSFCESLDFSKDGLEQVAIKIYLKLLDVSDKQLAIQEIENKLGYIPEYTPMMTWKEIQEVQKNGVVIGSHSHSHENLKIMSENELLEELKLSAKLIKENCHQPTNIIAYPNGQYNQSTLDYSYKCDYKYALTIENKAIAFNEKENIHVIPRINVYNTSFWKNWLKIEYYFKFK